MRANPNTAVHQLYTLYRAEFIRWAMKTTGSSHENAAEALQEGVIACYENAVNGNLEASNTRVKTYLFTVAANKLHDARRKVKFTTDLPDSQTINNKEIAEHNADEQRSYSIELLNQALDRMPADQSKLLRLYYQHGYDMESIAREMGLKNANTAKSKKVDCMKRLVQIFQELTANVSRERH